MAGFLSGRLGRKKKPGCSVVVPAAGNASRMQGVEKILQCVGEYPVLVHTVRALSACDRVNEIIIVTREDLILLVSQLCQDYGLNKVRKVIRGGATRAESVLAGVREVSHDSPLIAIHDGARPLVTPGLVEQVIAAAEERGAAAPAVPLKDTVKRAKNGLVTGTPDRSELFAVQTPQVFDADLIHGALSKAVEEHAPITDDCSAVERMGMSVFLVPGEDSNLKITTPVDLWIAEGILRGREL